MTIQLAAGPLIRNEAGITDALRLLRQRFGERFANSQAVRGQHGQNTTWLANQPPDCVVFPENTDEVVEIVRICSDHEVPIIPFGVGSSLEGHVNAPAGGVSVDFGRMNRILAVHAADLDCVVEPGVTRVQLNDHLRDQGLFFPIDPGADATFGGMAATRASGTNAVRYGTMRDNVINLTAVMPDGAVVKTGNRARKSSAGYDLARLLIGSEGTLGIITQLTLKLHGLPEAIAAGVVAFESVAGACDATIMTIQSGIPIARIELLDALMIRACNLYSKLDLPETPTLFVEFHGSSASVKEQAALFGEIARECGGGQIAVAVQPEDRSRLWKARHNVYHASFELRPGAAIAATDVCVPISRLADCVTETIAEVEAAGLLAPIVGHVGDGNFHLTLLTDPNDTDEIATTNEVIGRLNVRAIEMDGTCTGEHGIGQGKVAYLQRELGAGVGVMRAIKKAIDPKGIMNPGKIFAPA